MFFEILKYKYKFLSYCKIFLNNNKKKKKTQSLGRYIQQNLINYQMYMKYEIMITKIYGILQYFIGMANTNRKFKTRMKKLTANIIYNKKSLALVKIHNI